MTNRDEMRLITKPSILAKVFYELVDIRSIEDYLKCIVSMIALSWTEYPKSLKRNTKREICLMK